MEFKTTHYLIFFFSLRWFLLILSFLFAYEAAANGDTGTPRWSAEKQMREKGKKTTEKKIRIHFFVALSHLVQYEPAILAFRMPKKNATTT